jgi:hypothetical protein
MDSALSLPGARVAGVEQRGLTGARRTGELQSAEDGWRGGGRTGLR